MQDIKLAILVFLVEMIIMVVELAGSRLMAPTLGTSLITWTSLIGIIMVSMALGYFFGGKIADRQLNPQLLAYILLLASVSLSWILFAEAFVIADLTPTNQPILRNIVTILLTFFPVGIIMTSAVPVAIKLSLRSLSQSGATVGRLQAISTVGAITGTFLAGFVLVPNLGSKGILLLLAFVLILASLMFWTKVTSWLLALLLSSVGFALALLWQNVLSSRVVLETDTLYNHVIIEDIQQTSRPYRLLKLGTEFHSAVFLDENPQQDLVFPYLWLYDLGEYFQPQLEQALALGGAAYAYPQHFLQRYPQATIDVVEIDPALTDLAKQYFGLTDDPRLTTITEDARVFLNQNQKQYDVAYVDVFTALSPPFHLTTIESMQRLYQSLNPGAVMLMNIIGTLEGEQSQFIWSEYATVRAVFEQVYLLPTYPNNPSGKQNIMVIALKNPQANHWQSADPRLLTYLEQIWRQPTQTAAILTDDKAPVEFLNTKLLWR